MSFNIKHKSLWTVICLSLFLSGCASFIDMLDGPAKIRDSYYKPGEYVNNWKQDWIACGGLEDGGFEIDVPWDASREQIREVIEKETRKPLDVCMKAKGYTRCPSRLRM